MIELKEGQYPVAMGNQQAQTDGPTQHISSTINTDELSLNQAKSKTRWRIPFMAATLLGNHPTLTGQKRCQSEKNERS